MTVLAESMTRLLHLLLPVSFSVHPPNIVFVLVDDLGFAGVGFNSPTGEPKTPTIDKLSKEGAVLKRHYTYQYCSPTRSSFLSGRLPIHVNQENHAACELGGGVPPKMTMISAMLKKAGYSTHQAGKWHGGMSRWENIPINRGFDSSLGMLGGGADHYTNLKSCGTGKYVDLWRNDKPAHGKNGTYSEFIYVQHMVNVIEKHDVQQPLFLYMAFQNVHVPTEAPERFLNLYDESIFSKRRYGLAQISAVDEGIANITAALKAKAIWNNTLLIFSSDNGGPADHENNFPLRGSKASVFEGGVRTVAFVSGGWLPKSMRGGHVDGMMHIADWYATFAELASVDPADKQAEKAGLPPIDSLSMLGIISGTNKTSPRTEVPLAYQEHQALISGKYKFMVVDKVIHNGFFPGKTSPNGTDYKTMTNCTLGCLFDLEADEVEHYDLASKEPLVVASLKKRLLEIGETVYQSPSAGPQKDAETMAESYGGFWGPWEGFTPPIELV